MRKKKTFIFLQVISVDQSEICFDTICVYGLPLLNSFQNLEELFTQVNIQRIWENTNI